MKQWFSNLVTAAQSNIWYALTFVLLASLSLSLLGYEYIFDVSQTTTDRIMHIDLAIAYIFLTDFLLGLFFNNKYKMKDYWRHNWLDFVSSIPISADAARALRILRAFRAIRIISSALDLHFAKRRYDSLKK